MESWQASVDRRLGAAETSLSDLMWKGIYAACALAAMIAGLYLYIGAQISGVDDRSSKLADRVAVVEATTARVDERTAAIQKQQEKMDGKLDELVSRK